MYGTRRDLLAPGRCDEDFARDHQKSNTGSRGSLLDCSETAVRADRIARFWKKVAERHFVEEKSDKRGGIGLAWLALCTVFFPPRAALWGRKNFQFGKEQLFRKKAEQG